MIIGDVRTMIDSVQHEYRDTNTPIIVFKLRVDRPLERAPERQVNAHPPNDLVTTVPQLRHSVVAKARLTAPNGNVTVPDIELLHGIIALQAAELERRRQTKRHGYNRIGKIALVLVLVK